MFLVPRTLTRWASLPLIATVSFAATTLSEGYSIRVWRTEDGLPQNTVTSAVQTRDGYLWFGTYSGLARFDGERFAVFDTANTPELPDPRITCLFEDGSGTIWIGLETGMLARYREGRFATVPLRSDSAPNPVIGIGSDERDHLWAMRQNGHIDSLQGGPRLPSRNTKYNPESMVPSANVPSRSSTQLAIAPLGHGNGPTSSVQCPSDHLRIRS